MDYRRNDWKHFLCVTKKLQCQLSNKDDLQSKSVIKEIVLRINFYIRIDYRRNDFKQIVLILEIHSPLVYTAQLLGFIFIGLFPSI